jgi:7-keto-8-aminopelargonate synthetase-like enzyme
MLVELEEQLSRRYPDLPGLPEELRRRTTTVGELERFLAGRRGEVVDGGRPAETFPEVAALAGRLTLPGRLGIPDPYFVAHDGPLGATTRVGGTVLVDFSGYDYLGLATHPSVIAGACEAMARYGTSVSASRVASGERPVHGELEASIAGLLGAEAALTLVSGHATNLGVIGQLLRETDLALHDELIHDSILQGIRLSGARRQPFPHNDLAALDRLLRELAPRHPRVLVAAEGVYSMDGDLADLAGLVELRRRHGFLLYLDEAHSLGVLGATGRGAVEHWGVRSGDVDVLMGTLSKALASCGGYVAGSAQLIEYLRYTTPGFVYSVGLPPAAAGAALAAAGCVSSSTPPTPTRRSSRPWRSWPRSPPRSPDAGLAAPRRAVAS